MTELTPSQWTAQCADRLQLRWRTLDRMQLEEAAMALWREARWRGMAPAQAAAEWLRPVDASVEAVSARGVMEATVP